MFINTQLAGFGAARRSAGAEEGEIFFTRKDTKFNTDSPSFSIDLGETVGTKQVFMVFATNDDDIEDAFTVSATIDGLSMTEIHQAGRFGGGETVGVALFRRQLSSTGVVTVNATLSGFAGTMDRCKMGAVVVSGYNITPVDTDSADSALGTTATVNVSGAKLVVVGGARLFGAPGNLSGFGSKNTFATNNRTSIGYSIVSGSGDKTYTFDAAANAIVAASFALA